MDRKVKKGLQPLAVISLVLFFLGLPFWLVIVTAGKNEGESFNPSLALPTHWEIWKNFGLVLSEGRMFPALLGSCLIMIPSVLGVLLFGSMASWILGRRKSKVVSFAYALAISGVVLPPAIVTIVLLLRHLQLSGTVIGMCGVYMGTYMSVVIFFVTGFIRTIPYELEEAARIDGAKPTTIFFKIIVPILGPTLSTATILICLFIWNDVFYAFFVVGGRLDTLPLNLYQVASSNLYLQNWNLIFAYVILMSIPFLLGFMVFQRRIISGITSGAVK